MQAAARRTGVDWARLQTDLKGHSQDIADLLARNSEQAEALGLEGTPGFVVGHTQSFGAMTLNHLQVNVKEARAASRHEAAKG